MKKVLVLCLAMLLVMTVSFTAYATTGGFVESPSNNKAPVLEDFDNESEDCEAELIITSYADRDKLSDTAKDNLEKAYEIIKKTMDLIDLNSGLEDLADKLDVSASSLAVSDLFDIGVEEDTAHNTHGKFTVTVSSETLKDFVSVMYLNDDKWELVDGAEIDKDGHLSFETDKVGAYAIVVSADAKDDVATGNAHFPWYCVVLIIASVVALGWSLKKKDKENVTV